MYMSPQRELRRIEFFQYGPPAPTPATPDAEVYDECDG